MIKSDGVRNLIFCKNNFSEKFSEFFFWNFFLLILSRVHAPTTCDRLTKEFWKFFLHFAFQIIFLEFSFFVFYFAFCIMWNKTPQWVVKGRKTNFKVSICICWIIFDWQEIWRLDFNEKSSSGLFAKLNI